MVSGSEQGRSQKVEDGLRSYGLDMTAYLKSLAAEGRTCYQIGSESSAGAAEAFSDVQNDAERRAMRETTQEGVRMKRKSGAERGILKRPEARRRDEPGRQGARAREEGRRGEDEGVGPTVFTVEVGMPSYADPPTTQSIWNSTDLAITAGSTGPSRRFGAALTSERRWRKGGGWTP